MTKVLLIQETISHYNVPIYDLLAEKYDLCVLHSDKKCCGREYNFKTLYVPYIRIRHFGFLHTKNIIKIANHFDVVICMFAFSYIYFRKLATAKRNYKLIYWGIGVSASYDQRYDVDQSKVSRYLQWISDSDAVVFYSDYPVNKYVSLGADKNKLFVANNTVKVNKISPDDSRKNFLFIGSLYKQKKVMELLIQYNIAVHKNPDIPLLYIIGNGAEKEQLEEFIRNNGLNNKIIMCGEITNDNELETYFKKTLLCISPDQAGLSVLKAMGYGTVFVTHKNAITGGERLNIVNGETGILFDDFNQISDLLIDSTVNKSKYLEIGNKAYQHYWKCRKPEDMAQGFIESITYALNR